MRQRFYQEGDEMDFRTIMQTYTVIIEAHTPLGVQRQQLSGPRFVIEQQFLGITQQAMKSADPVKIVMKRQEQEWNNYENRNVTLEYSITYANPHYISIHQEEFDENHT